MFLLLLSPAWKVFVEQNEKRDKKKTTEYWQQTYITSPHASIYMLSFIYIAKFYF